MTTKPIDTEQDRVPSPEEKKIDRAMKFLDKTRRKYCLGILYDALCFLLIRALKQGVITNQTHDALIDGWLKNANPEALADWLEAGGIKQIDLAELEKELELSSASEHWEEKLSRGDGREPFNEEAREKEPRPWLQIPGDDGHYIPSDISSGIVYILRYDPALFVAGATGPDMEALDPPARWLQLLIEHWLREAAETIETRQKAATVALPLEIQRKNIIRANSTGSAFLRFPAVLQDAGAWCGSLVEVDGNTIFAEEPNLAAKPVQVLKDDTGKVVQVYQPRAWTIAAEHRLAGPRQLVLPGMLKTPHRNPEMDAFLAVTATDAAALDLSGLSVKVLLALLGMCPLDGTPAKGPIQNMVKIVYPDWQSRRKMNPSKKDMGDKRRVVAAMASLMNLRMAEKINDSLRIYPLLQAAYLDIPLTPGADPEFMVGLNKTLAERTTLTKGKANWFLLNLSRIMDLDASRPEHIAVAIRFSAYWHTCRQRTKAGRVFMHDRLDYLKVDDFLIETNCAGRLPDLINGIDLGNMGKVKLSEARARFLDETVPTLVQKGILPALDASAIKRPSRYAGRGAEAWQIKPPPPKDYLEACAKTGRTSPRNGG